MTSNSKDNTHNTNDFASSINSQLAGANPPTAAVNPLSSLGNSQNQQQQDLSEGSTSRSKNTNVTRRTPQIENLLIPIQQTSNNNKVSSQEAPSRQSLSINPPAEQQEEVPFALLSHSLERQSTQNTVYSVPTASGTPTHGHSAPPKGGQHPCYVNSPLLSPTKERPLSGGNKKNTFGQSISKVPTVMSENKNQPNFDASGSKPGSRSKEHLRPTNIEANGPASQNRNVPSPQPEPTQPQQRRRGSVSREATADPMTPGGGKGLNNRNDATMRIDILDNERNRARDYPNNSICTSKYTIVSFIPLNLFEQFRRISNFYFLIVMVLTLIPGASPVSPFSAIAPLALVVGVAAIKDAYEDYKRHRSDEKANSIVAHVLRGGEFIEVPSESVQVGDVLKIYHGEEIRADCVLLSSSLPEGLAYIETANLDGETNAKTRKSLDATHLNLSTVEQLLARCNVTEPPRLSMPQKIITTVKAVPSSFVAGAKNAVNSVAEGFGFERMQEDNTEMRRKRADEDANAPTFFDENNSFGAACPDHEDEEVRTPINMVSNNANANLNDVSASSSMKRNPTDVPMSPAPDTPQQPIRSDTMSPARRSQTVAGHAIAEALKSEAEAEGIEMQAPVKGLSTLSQASFAIGGKSGVRIIASLPDPNLAHWQGVLKMGPADTNALGLDNFLFRGAILRNTEWAIAAVVYSGVETKMFLNLKQKPPKRSQFDRQMNVLMLAMFVISIVLCISFASAAVAFHNKEDPWYAFPGIYQRNSGAIWGWRFITHFILLSYLIPISLFITLELNKGFQILFISMDIYMAEYDSNNEEWRTCRPKTSNLTSQLARVKYIFADKTGTLTENCMKFVGGHIDNMLFKTSDNIPIGASAATEADRRAQDTNNQNLLINDPEEIPQQNPNDNDSVLVRSEDIASGPHQGGSYSVPSIGGNQQRAESGLLNQSGLYSHQTTGNNIALNNATAATNQATKSPGVASERSNDYATAEKDRRDSASSRGGNNTTDQAGGGKMRDVIGADGLGWELIRCGFEPSGAFVRKKKREELEQNRIEMFAGLAQVKDKSLAKKLSLKDIARRGSAQPSPMHASHSNVAHSRFASMLGVNAPGNLFHSSAHREWPTHISHSRTTSQVRRTASGGGDPAHFAFPSGPASPNNNFPDGQHLRSESNHISIGNNLNPGGRVGSAGGAGPLTGLLASSAIFGGPIIGDSSVGNHGFASFHHGRVVSMGAESQASQASVAPARVHVLERSSLFLYLLSLSACHSVVCFDPNTKKSKGGHSSPKSVTPHASSPMGSMILNSAADISTAVSPSKVTVAATSTSEPVPIKPKLRKIYEGQSLDEVALVQAAADNFFELVERSTKEMTIEIMGRCYTYDIIAELEFTPQRKLMSIILKRNKSKDVTAQQRRRSYIAHSRSMASMDHGKHSRNPSRIPRLLPSQSMASLHSNHHRRSISGQQRGGMDSHAQFGSFKRSQHHPHHPLHSGQSLLANTNTLNVSGGSNAQHHNSQPSSLPDAVPVTIVATNQSDPLNNTNGNTQHPQLNNDTFTPALINVVVTGAQSNSTSNPAVTTSGESFGIDLHNVSSGAIGSGSPNGVSALLHFENFGATATPSASITHNSSQYNSHNNRAAPHHQNNNTSSGGLGRPQGSNNTPSEEGALGSSQHRSSGTYANGAGIYYHFPNHEHVFNHDDSTMLRILDESDESVYPYLMLTKGADSSMLPIIDMSVQMNIDMSPLVEESLNKMASTGLRTLVLGYRKLSQQDVDTLLPILREAHQCMGDRNKVLHEAYAHIEKSISLIGATAVEDKLQDGVPETIDFLLRAKVVVWMLTGDKRETAVTIAGTSGIIDPIKTEEVIHIDVTTVPDEEKIFAVSEQIRRAKVLIDRQPPNTVVLVIDGVSLNAALQADVVAGFDLGGSVSLSESMGSQGNFPENCPPISPRERSAIDVNFFELGSKCRAAVCCRMTPLQKADIVRMFQTTTGHVALAIGDGANDVSMIQEAEIGIGIMGLEGAQAELAADFAIPKFRFLKRLMVVHGRHNLYRDSQTVLFCIYKCVVIVVALSLYTSKAGFSGQSAFNSWFLSMFNSFYCQIQALAIGIFDKDLPDEVLETNPMLYTELAEKKSYFNPREWVFNIIEAAVLGVVLSLAALTTLHTSDISHDHSASLADEASIWFIVIVVIMDTAATLRFLRTWTPLTIGVMIFGYSVLLVFTFALCSITNFGGSTELADVAWKLFGTFSIYSHVFLGVFGFFTCVTLVKYYLIDELLFPSSHATKVVERVIGKHDKAIATIRKEEKQRLRQVAEAAAALAAKDILEAQREEELLREEADMMAALEEENNALLQQNGEGENRDEGDADFHFQPQQGDQVADEQPQQPHQQ